MSEKSNVYGGKTCVHGHGNLRYVGNRYCVECVRLYHVGYRKAHRAKRRAWNREYVKRHYEKVRARIALYKAAHPEKHRAHVKKWRKANKPAGLAQRARRVALKHAAPGNGVSAPQWRKVLRESLGLCVWCNSRSPLEMEHIDPLSLGGAHDVENITAACRRCNSSKSNTPLLLWLANRKGKAA